MKMRQVLRYPLHALAAILGLYAVFTVLALLGVPTWHWTAVRGQAWYIRLFLISGGCIVAGFLRLAMLHPRYATKYAGWLMTSPWRAGMRLPLGPAWLAWEDLLLLVPLGILAKIDANFSPWIPATFYVLGYSIAAVCAIRESRVVWFVFCLAFLWSLAALFHASEPILLSVVLAIALFSCWAVSISLRQFPWDLGEGMREINRRPRASLAWPLDRVGPVLDMKPITLAVGWTAALLSGWWFYVVLALFAEAHDRDSVNGLSNALPVMATVLAILFRLGRYNFAYWPPIGFFGRIFTGRWIIPKYDYVLIAPALIVAADYSLPRVLAAHLPEETSAVIAFTTVIAIALNCGPSLQHWRLTGHHRMVPTVKREPPVPKSRNARL
jgi:hypothetical protein